MFEYELLHDKSGYAVFINTSICRNSKEKKIVVPKMYNGLPIKVLKDLAFSYFTSLEEIVLPDTIIEIGDSCFKRCENLKRINLPKSLEVIGKGAFYFCVRLSKLELGPKIKTLGDLCFQRCENIGDIEIPSSVTDLGDDIFCNCLNTKVVTFNSVPSIIHNNSFKSKYINKICFKLSFKEFEPFVNYIPKQYHKIIYVFENNNYVKLPINEDSIYNDILYVNNAIVHLGQYSHKTYVKKVVFGPQVRQICGGAFSHCTNLVEVEFSEGVESIGTSVFANTKIERLLLPESLTDINMSAFYFMNYLKFISFPSTVLKFCNWIVHNKNIEVRWPKRVKIPYCDSLSHFDLYPFEELTFPEGVEEIDENVISNGNKNIKTIVFPKSLQLIKSRAFNNIDNLINVTYLNECTAVSPNAFYQCGSYKNDVKMQSTYVKCKDGLFPVNKIHSIKNKKDIDNLFHNILFGFQNKLLPFDPATTHNVDDLIDNLLANKNVEAADKVTIQNGYNHSVGIRFPESMYSVAFSKAEVEKNIYNFTTNKIIALYCDKKTSFFALIKVGEMTKENMWGDFNYNNEDTFISCFLDDQKGNNYWLLLAVYDY